MPIKAKYLFVASMDVDADKEALFNEVYDTEHVPMLSKVPGVHAVARMEGEPFTLNIGGEERKIVYDGPRYHAMYEIDGPHVRRPKPCATRSAAQAATCSRSSASASARSTPASSASCRSM